MRKIFIYSLLFVFAIATFDSCADKVLTPANSGGDANSSTGVLNVSSFLSGIDDGQGGDFLTAKHHSHKNLRDVSPAAQTNAVPITSWAKIKDVRYFICDKNNLVVKSISVKNPTDGSLKPLIIKEGTYYIVAVANPDQNVNNLLDVNPKDPQHEATVSAWTDYNVQHYNINTALALELTSNGATFPAVMKDILETTGHTPIHEPGDILIGRSEAVTVTKDNVSKITLTLRRQVSLMRVRLNKKGKDGSIDNSDVNFAHDSASFLIYRQPGKMFLNPTKDRVAVDTAGRLSQDILSLTYISDSNPLFYTQDPSTDDYKTINGDGSQPKIITPDFPVWRDIRIFPNVTAYRTDDNATDTLPDKDSVSYFIVLAGFAKKGHIIDGNKKLTTDKTLYWQGTLKQPFFPNAIREVNLTLKTGGADTIPIGPTDHGSMEITVNVADWDTPSDSTLGPNN